ncbi:dTDP-4-dehydrorhamnose 3,5-epimerase [Clostridium estertheticum]|uniref:dTDP-4-dehydrorhamnose 3,5-epimerase n=1 Tax=Clostridium estertheticum TaxID=238834 RepID=UPI0013E954CE|nr:dTDP-4-dehydrorhamnose 3,5-epimerase [Clostridium estertheticum]MBZ9686401.1 dTDP-4-dehydrorhamnose 3,5-epimerase [Clostridium estertheticum]
MGEFSIEKTSMKGVFLIDSFSTEDSRGYFVKDFEKEIFAKNGLDIDLYESFESFSWENVIRGLHFQTHEPQAKLVRAITGEILDVIVDLRAGSETFGKWEKFYLTERKRKSLFITKGFAHGFCVLSKTAIVSYKCGGKYHKGTDSGIVWNDEDLSIDWDVQNPIISERDSALMTFKDFIKNFNALLKE